MFINNKNSFRTLYSSIRNGIDKQTKQNADSRIITTLINTDEFRKSRNILVYSSFRSEINTDELIDFSFKSGKSVFLPVWKSGNMDFYEIINKSDLSKNLRGILIPDKSQCRKFEENKDCLCIIPGLSFDSEGNRLGFGGGYYDRFLALHPQIKTIGLCYDRCICGIKLPAENHDIPIKIIITETSVLRSDI